MNYAIAAIMLINTQCTFKTLNRNGFTVQLIPVLQYLFKWMHGIGVECLLGVLSLYHWVTYNALCVPCSYISMCYQRRIQDFLEGGSFTILWATSHIIASYYHAHFLESHSLNYNIYSHEPVWAYFTAPIALLSARSLLSARDCADSKTIGASVLLNMKSMEFI